MIDSHTALLGLIGNPLGHSLSPQMHNHTLRQMGLNYIYLPLQVEEKHLPAALAGLQALNFRGVNVTIPYKKAVIQFLDELSPAAAACEAVNLIKNEKGRLIGFNTDGKGFMASLQEEGAIAVARVIMIGAGGAAHSIAYELAMAGAKQINILDIIPAQATALAEFVNSLPQSRAKGMGMSMSDEVFSRLSREADLIINCTPVGMFPQVEQTAVKSFADAANDAVVYDLIYNPLCTRFLAVAQTRNLKTINGLSMLVHQGALTLKILTGEYPPLDYMKEVVSNGFQPE